MTKIEQVARALCKTTGSNPDAQIPLDPDGDDRRFVLYWTEYVPEARAAIDAMREPTEEMLLQGAISGTRLLDNVDMKCAKEDADSTWVAMIDAALTEGRP